MSENRRVTMKGRLVHTKEDHLAAMKAIVGQAQEMVTGEKPKSVQLTKAPRRKRGRR